MDSQTGSQSTEQLHYKSGGSDNKVPLILSILAVLIAVIGVVIAAVGLARSSGSNVVINGIGGSPAGINAAEVNSNADDDRIWLLAIGHAGVTEEYLDEATGQIKGYHVDIANAVCKIAGRNCQLVEDIWTNCWNSEAGQTPRGGTGLMAGYYDACTAWWQTSERHRTFKFADPIAVEPTDVVFIVKAGNPGKFDHRDISGKVIGFGDGWATDEYCLGRDSNIGGTLATEDIRHFGTEVDMVAAILDDSVDAVFTYGSYFKSIDGVELIDEHATSCDIGGRSMMMRKDNTLWKWWNPALAKLVKSPEYQLICNDLIEQHGHLPGSGTEICLKA